jgi:hypothetical protein
MLHVSPIHSTVMNRPNVKWRQVQNAKLFGREPSPVSYQLASLNSKFFPKRSHLKHVALFRWLVIPPLFQEFNWCRDKKLCVLFIVLATHNSDTWIPLRQNSRNKYFPRVQREMCFTIFFQTVTGRTKCSTICRRLKAQCIRCKGLVQTHGIPLPYVRVPHCSLSEYQILICFKKCDL